MPELPLSPLFWAGHYDIAIGSPLSETILEAAGEPYESMYEWHTVNPTPSFVFDLSEGYCLRVDYEKSEVVYSFTHQSSERIVLGYHSGHWALPGLRWCELRQIHRIREAHVGLGQADLEFLFLFPCAWILEIERDEARGMLARSWPRIPDLSPALIEKLVDQSSDPHDVAWQADPELGWITNGRYSARNPECLMFENEKEYFDDVRKFVSAIEA
jgi:hypothetical protein